MAYQTKYQITSFKTSKSSTFATKFCKVCFDSGKSKEEYTSHFIRETPDKNSKVVCPTLLSLTCQYCKGSGHTPRYCPILEEKQHSQELKMKKPSTKTFIPVFVKKENGKKELKSDFFQKGEEPTTKTKTIKLLINDVEIPIPKEEKKTITRKQKHTIPLVPRSVYINHFELLNQDDQDEQEEEEEQQQQNEMDNNQKQFPSKIGMKERKKNCIGSGAWSKPLQPMNSQSCQKDILSSENEIDNQKENSKPFSFKDALLIQKEEPQNEDENDGEDNQEDDDNETSNLGCYDDMERMEWGDFLLDM